MAQIDVPGLGWLDEPGSLGSHDVPGQGWFDDSSVGTDAVGQGTPGQLTLTGPAGQGSGTANAAGDPGTLTMTGPTGSAESVVIGAGDPGTLTMTAPQGAATGEVVGGGSPGTLTLTGPSGRAFGAGPRASELTVLALGGVEPLAAASELAVLAAVEVLANPRASELAVLVAGEIVPDLQASQLAVLVLAESQPCVTMRCQIWRIVRKDGVVMRYTSLDRDVMWGGFVYQHCRSLDPSASESASTIGSVGSIELSGIIDDAGISDEDIYGGVYDDAFVDVWLISWGDVTDTPKRIAAGNIGQISQGEDGHQMEVVGPGARLDQQAVTDQYTAACSWTFGDPATCKVDAEALAITGEVQAGIDRSTFMADLSSLSTGPQWANGVVRWSSGRNIGYRNEVKHIDFDTGQVTLWALTVYVPAAGDEFSVIPGCDKLKGGGCRLYDNVINHGGFADLPGDDALQDTPNAQVD